LPVLKKTVIPDIRQHIMAGYWDDKNWNGTDMIYRFPNGTVFQFIPSDSEDRWHGLRSHIVYFDELFYIKKSIFMQASIRTSERIFASFNPVSKFWITDFWDDKETEILHSTYKDNPYLSETVINALETRISKDENFRRVYLLGQWGSLEGLIFKEGVHWDIIPDEVYPLEYKKRVVGLDFGYSIDPAAMVDVRYQNGEIWLDELLYKREMLNSDLFTMINKDMRVVADSAEPKSIAELKMMGADVRPSVKGKDSINSGISLIKEFRIHVTASSVNMIKELRSYRWDENRQGETLTKPIDDWNHLCDATRYALGDMMNGKIIKFI